MANDLISRNALLDAMPKDDELFSLDVRRVILNAPAVDAAPVVQSQWKYFRKQNTAVCLNCSFERDLDANFGAAVACPNCGALMK